MRLVDNIYHSQGGDYGIDLGYRPTTHTRVRVLGKAYNDGNLYVGTGPESSQPSGQWFRLFTYQSDFMTFDCPEDSMERIDTMSNIGYEEEYEFGFTNTGTTIFLQNNTQSVINTAYVGDKDLSAFDGQTNSTIKIWGDGTYYSGPNTSVKEIWVYEDNVLTAHFLPAVDDLGNGEEAGMYDEIGGVFYPKCQDSLAIQWDEKSPIEYDRISNVIFDASGGTTGATIIVNYQLSGENYHWGVKQLTDLNGMGSAFTLNYNGQTGLTEISGKTDGTISFEFAADPWDGSDASGGTWNKKYRTAVWHITLYDDGTDDPWGGEDFAQRVRQINPLHSGGTPVYIGEDAVDTMYAGEDQVLAAYIGEDLVFEG